METVTTPGGDVSVVFDGPRAAPFLLVLGHGAGHDMNADFMVTIAQGLARHGHRVCRFNFPYAERGKKPPDRQPVLEAAFAAVVEAARAGHPKAAVVAGGKSLGGRIASHVVAAGLDVAGLVFLGYPLHPPGRPDRLRAAHLGDVRVPMLFVEGTRDPFCPLPTLERVRASLVAPTEVAIVDDGDHSFKVRRSADRSTEQAWDEVVGAVSTWLGAIPPPAASR